ncbi:hypothetical protein AB0C13_28990 [Streptomyces sp. NPDC049099]|uniref:hypothetical protein n=1 Tax=Streptomyces sp. NPDC049099 TaxID=3155768 RepID=UPI0034377F3F
MAGPRLTETDVHDALNGVAGYSGRGTLSTGFHLNRANLAAPEGQALVKKVTDALNWSLDQKDS